MTTDSVQGYALRRNNTCGNSEVTCTENATWDNWQACCPQNSFCFDSKASQANFICCESHLNCTAKIATAPTCADKSWNLFNSTGYFCCEEGQDAFNVDKTVWVGCADPGFAGGSEYISLETSSVGTPVASSTATSSPSSTSTSSTFSTTPSSDIGSSNPDNSSHTNTGAIAGGVVGGVVGVAAIAALLFFLLRSRKRQQSQQQTQYQDPPPAFSEDVHPGKGMHARELDGQARLAELNAGDTAVHQRHELPAYR